MYNKLIKISFINESSKKTKCEHHNQFKLKKFYEYLKISWFKSYNLNTLYMW